MLVAFANFRGVYVKGCSDAFKSAEIVELPNSTHFCVPTKSGTGSASHVIVKVGDVVKMGSVLASPVDNTSAFIYSPVSGSVNKIEEALNAFGEHCKVIEIEPAHKDSYLNFKPLEEQTQTILFGRLVESGSVDTWGRRLPSYFKYVNAKNKVVKTLIIKLFDSDGYCLSNAMLSKFFAKEIAVGASLFYKVAGAKDIVFVYLNKQAEIVQKIKESIIGQGIMSANLNFVKVPDLYPVDYDNLLVRQVTKKIVKIGQNVEEYGVAIENAQTCFNFYNAVINNQPTTQTLYTLSGSNFKAPVFAFVKNGFILEEFAQKAEPSKNADFDNFVVGGALAGVAQFDKKIGLPVSATSVHSFKFKTEQNREVGCINCGKCNRICPTSLSPVMLDNYALLKEYGRAKKYGAEACIGCGACSFVCPSKRFLTQRITEMKSAIGEGRTM